MNSTRYRYFVASSLAVFSLFLFRSPAFSQTVEFVALLSGGSQVPANESLGSGTITATLNGNTLTVSGTFGGLSSPMQVEGIAIRVGLAGQNGSVIYALVPTMNPDNLGGTLNGTANTFPMMTVNMQRLLTHGLYVNIASQRFPSGELRGQLMPTEGTRFHAKLSGRAEVPPGEFSRTEATGGAALELRNDTLIVSGSFTGLESDRVTSGGGGAHLHIGSADAGGPVLFPLVVSPGADSRSGALYAPVNMFALNAEQIAALEAGDLYINIHSMGRMGGEIRGQVLPEETRVFEAFLAARNQTRSVPGDGSGGITAFLSGNELKVSGIFQNLISPFLVGETGAGLFLGAGGTEGDLIFPLVVSLDEDSLGGTFSIEANTFTLSSDQREGLLNGNLYVNVRSKTNEMGELRGQLLPGVNLPPAVSGVFTPEEGATVVMPDDLQGGIEAEWEAAHDPNGNGVRYRWELSTTADFSSAPVLIRSSETTAFVPFFLLDIYLTGSGIGIGPQGLRLYHRLVAVDGSLWGEGETRTLVLKRESAGVEDDNRSVLFADVQVRSNPFSDRVSIRFNLARPATVRLELFDMRGERLQSVQTEVLREGEEELRLDVSELANGVYGYRLTAADQGIGAIATGRVILVR